MEWNQNRKVGLWQIQDSYMTTPKGERKWLCCCECGTERYVFERSLKYGSSKSCGCMTRKKALEAVEHTLYGKTFGDLTVIEKAEKKKRNGGTWWLCRCTCGKLVEVSGTLLVNGRKTHCGCKTSPKNYYYIDISNQTFGRLTAKYALSHRDSKGGLIWHCQCTCGNEVDVPYNVLVYSGTQSCGCQKREHESNIQQLLTRVDGTSVDLIKSKKLPIDNTTGVKGVYFIRGKYVAKIVFQKKQYYLGEYDNIEKARKARKEAEVLLFDGSVSHYEKWKVKADSDPIWAEKNPIEIRVEKNILGELEVTFLPFLL